jgi:hypothetical protein
MEYITGDYCGESEMAEILNRELYLMLYSDKSESDEIYG